MNYQMKRKHGRSSLEYTEKTLSQISGLFKNFQEKKIIAEERQNGFGESSPVFYDGIHFVAEGK